MKVRIALLAAVGAIMGATIVSAASAAPASAASPQKPPVEVQIYGSTWS